MKIRLKEIPQEGRDYLFDRETAELDRDLADLIKDNDYTVKMNILPIGQAYEMRGELKTAICEVCSKCGYDFDLPISRRFHEILLEEQEDYRKSHSVHGNQSVDFLGNGPSMVPVKGEIFLPGEYVHEMIGLSQPFYPMCGEDGACMRASEVEQIQQKLEREWELAAEKRDVNPAFSVLQNLNLNKN